MGGRYANGNQTGVNRGEKLEVRCKKVKSEKKHMVQWLGGMLMLLLMLTACSSGSDEPKDPKPVLKIYLFAPESPIVTRASIGNVNASDDEKRINTLDVWVFEHDTHNYVSYVHLDNLLFTGQKEIVMEISDDFADQAKKPNVDIYVAANASDLGLTLNKGTTLADLKAACIGSAYFGVSTPVMRVPNGGLPMSGLLEDQTVSGESPVYSAKTQNVKLVRAVSKMRFIFSKSSSNPPEISNLSISLNADMLPKEEYLFLEGIYPTYKSHVKTTGESPYEAATPLLSGKGDDDISSCDNPVYYAYDTSETGQAYETKINDGIAAGHLSELGTFYFRESDKKLEGTISYMVGTTPKSPDFKMANEGDFTRNHTWIVYGYFLGSGELKLNVVDVKAWTENTSNPEVYNW